VNTSTAIDAARLDRTLTALVGDRFGLAAYQLRTVPRPRQRRTDADPPTRTR
jgi:hypothetical protein